MKKLIVLICFVFAITFAANSFALDKSLYENYPGVIDFDKADISTIYPYAKCVPLGSSKSTHPATEILDISYECEDGYVLYYGSLFALHPVKGLQKEQIKATLTYILYDPSTKLEAIFWNGTTNYIKTPKIYSIPSERLMRLKEAKYLPNAVKKVQSVEAEKSIDICKESRLAVCEANKSISDVKENYRILRECLRAPKFCQENRPLAEAFLDKIRVEPIIVDESGLYSSEDLLFQISKNLSSDKCPTNLEEVFYSIEINLNDKSPFIVDVEPTDYNLKFNSEGYILKPKVMIHSKSFDGIYPNALFESKDLAVRISIIASSNKTASSSINCNVDNPDSRCFDIAKDDKSIDNDKIDCSLDLINRTDQYISIEVLSIYINDSILTNQEVRIELPPQGVKNNFSLTFFKGADKEKVFEKAIDAIRVKADKTSVKKTIAVGLSAKYEINNTKQTLFKKDVFTLGTILKEKM